MLWIILLALTLYCFYAVSGPGDNRHRTGWKVCWGSWALWRSSFSEGFLGISPMHPHGCRAYAFCYSAVRSWRASSSAGITLVDAGSKG